MMPPTPNALLDMGRSKGQIACSFRWQLVNRWNGVRGDLHPEVGVSLTNDTSGTGFRTIHGLRLRESEWRDIDVFSDYVRPIMVLEDGTKWPLGTLAFASNPVEEGSLESQMEASLLDRRCELAQTLPHSYGIPDGGLVRPAMVELVEMFGFQDYEIGSTDARIGGGPVNWSPTATGLQALESLCQRAGFFPPYFSNDNVLTMRPATAPEIGYAHRYKRQDGRIASLRREGNPQAPNTFRVISSGSTSSEISAVAYVDASLRHSRERTGRERVKVVRRQGLPDTAACLAVAESYARASDSQYAKMALTSVPDPRHDTFEAVEIDGAVYREVGWTMELVPGGEHSHRLVGLSLPDDVDG